MPGRCGVPVCVSNYDKSVKLEGYVSDVPVPVRSSSRRTRIGSSPFNPKKKSDAATEHFALPPWPEWSDAQLNVERWDVHHAPSHHSVHDGRRRSPSTWENSGFEDPLGHIQLPPSLQPHIWIRLQSLPLIEMYHASSVTAPILDLTTPNTHLLHSEVMRWIIAAIMNLHQLGRAHTVELEGQDEAFHIQSGKWKPWHHIYALCKVPKSGPHTPHINPHGKYIVRLFYMGCWRRITIDDYIPLDSERRPLLPMTASGREIWPALLSKALLKVAALSWTPEKEILDFSVMACLTGWHAQELDLTAVPSRTIWWLCQKLLSAECDDPEARFTGVRNSSFTDIYGPSFMSRESIDYSSVEAEFIDPAAEVIGSVVLCAVVQTPAPSVEHPVLITEAKINSQGEDRPSTPLWKTFRWKKWALEQGLLVDTSEKNVKCIRMYSPLLKRQPDMEQAARITSVIDMSIPSEAKVTDRRSSEIQSLQERRDQRISEHSMFTQQTAAKGSSHVIPEKSISRIKSQHEAKQSKFPEFWIKFEKLVQCVKRFEIYYKTKSFVHNLKVTDISHISQESKSPHRKRHKEHSKQHENVKRSSSSGTTLKTGRNKQHLRDNMLYLLTDSMACKKLLLSFSVLKPPVSLSETLHTGSTHHRLSSTIPPKYSDDDDDDDEEEEKLQKIPPTYYIQGESYDWQSSQVEDITFEIKTVATTCQLIQLEEGLIVFRLWMKLPEVYALRISSQTPFVLGTKEMIQEILCGHSTSWKHYGSNFSRAFNELMNIHKNSPNHEELLENLHKSYLPPEIPKPSSKFAARLRRKIFSRFEKALMRLLFEQNEDDTIAQVVSEWRWLLQKEKFGSRISLMTKSGGIPETRWSQLLNIIESSEIVVSRSAPTVKTFTNEASGVRLTKSDNKIIATKASGVTLTRSDKLNDSSHTHELSSVGGHKTTFDQEAGINFLRQMFSEQTEILRYYPFRNDDKHHIHFADYHGMAHTFGQKWIPLVRFVVNVHENEDPYCAVYLTTTLTSGVIQVINNDTLTQHPRLLGDTEPSHFPYNRHGYTIFAYGYDDENKDHQWKIRLLTDAEQQLPHPCNWNTTTNTCSPQELPSLTIKEVKGHYLPNKRNVIFECLLTLEQTQNLTLRTVMSNSNVKFLLKIRRGDGDVIAEYEGYGQLIIPVLRLEGRDSGGPDFFRIEAQVVDKSWTLNSEEMIFVEHLKEKVLHESMVFIGDHLIKSKSKRRLKTNSSETKQSDEELRSPFWILMLVVDEDLCSTVKIEQDKRREEEIRDIKVKWEQNKPGRYLTSHRVRQEFLARGRYSAYLRGFIHEQGVEYGEKTKYLLEHLSCRESECRLDSKEITEHNRQEENRKRIEKFQEEYAEIRNQFSTIRKNQIRRNTREQIYLEKFSMKSKMMKAEAYEKRDNCVDLIKPEEHKRRSSIQSAVLQRKSTFSHSVKQKTK